MTDTQRRAAAKQFAADWQGKGYEKGHSQTFWLSLLQKVYGVEEPDKFITFEDQIMLDHTSFIDGFIPSTHVLIEQKSLGKELNKPIKQSYGSLLSPFQQAKRYVHIMTPYLILDDTLLRNLGYAAKRGVDTAIIMPHIPDKKYAYLLARSYYPELIEAGVQISEYMPAFVHATSFVSDDEKAVVGTINLDFRSLYLHFECGVY